MKLYNIMIVDDEAAVREGMVNRVKWEDLGFRIVAEAENGEEALEKAEFLDIDVVLSDIKMPFMDGITMAERLLRDKPHLKLIFLTGFDEFEYAQEAIRLKAIDYILKPINSFEVKDMLIRVKGILDKEIEEKRNIEILEERYRESLPFMRIQFLHEVLTGSLNNDEVSSRMKLYNIPIDIGKYRAVSFFDISSPINEEELRLMELTTVSVKNIVDEAFQGKCNFISFISLSSIIVISSWQEEAIGELMDITNDVCITAQKILNTIVTSGTGRFYKELTSLKKSYKESKAAVEYKAVIGEGRAIYIKDMESIRGEESIFDSIAEKKLLMAIKFGPISHIEENIQEIMDKLSEVESSEWSYNTYILAVLNTLFSIIQRYKLNEKEILGDREQWYSVLSREISKEMLRNKLLNISVKMNTSISERRVTSTKKIVEEAKKYIDNHYYESDLSVDKVCRKIHISQSYFSTIFKKETGQNYIQYLTEVRLNKALELLRETEDKTYVIAQKVGYEEPNYFRYVFKKRFKVSPSSFRK